MAEDGGRGSVDVDEEMVVVLGVVLVAVEPMDD